MKEKQSLQDSHPELSLEAEGWDPGEFSFGSDKSMQRKCNIGHQWTAQISDRVSGKGRCHICLGKRVLKSMSHQTLFLLGWQVRHKIRKCAC